MGEFNNIKKISSFYVSSLHLVTMIFPYIKKEIELKNKFMTFSEYNLKENVDLTLSKLIINDEEKKNILNIGWEAEKIYKFSSISKKMKNSIVGKEDLNILIIGNLNYINIANKNIKEFITKNKLINKTINIIDCFEVSLFNDNIRDILDTHEYILNTSGIHEVCNVFEGYKKKIAN